jgi:metallo-beta-lactamase class B
MHKWVGTTLIAFFSVLSPSWGVQKETSAGRQTITDDLEVELIADDVWLHTSRHPELGRGNGLVVVAGGEAALIDTPWTNEQTRHLVSWVSQQCGARVSKVVVTHSHPDNLGGLAVAHELGAESYAHSKTAAFAERDGNEVPKNVFDDSLQISIGTRVLQPRFVGPGHTVDNIVVWIPDVEILFGGCLVRPGLAKTLGFAKEADLEQWPATIETLLEDYGDAKLIVPGHGSPGGRELLDRTLELLKASK